MAEKKGKAPSGPQLFFRETFGELRKVTWPTWPEASRLTILVLIVMTVVGIFLAIVQEISVLLLKVLLGS
ncbi:MAG: preprotein translocase subunit SecE [Chloroflexi bacterium]|nr:preprotein translocase subunit SecE [Chloroflexota bacterium]